MGPDVDGGPGVNGETDGERGEGLAHPQSGSCDWFLGGIGVAFLRLSGVPVEKELVVHVVGGVLVVLPSIWEPQ